MMNTKSIITGLLLVFVTVTLVYVVVDETRTGGTDRVKTGPTNPATTNPDGPSTVADGAAESKVGVVVYYFHGDFRCEKCRKFEEYTVEALNTNFAGEMKNGSLKLAIVNIDQKGNEHFVMDYSLVTRSVVLSKTKDGKQTDWKNLTKIWDLVGDKGKFIEYITSETEAYLYLGGE